jgi:hypothetical protein
MKTDEDIKKLNDKIDKILYNQERNKELSDLSNLENTNFAIFISVLAIVISVLFGWKVNLLELSLVPLFLSAIILITFILIFNEVYLIYKDDIRGRFNLFYMIIYFIFNLALFPFLIFFLYYFGELYYIDKIYLLIISLISSIIFGSIVTILIARFFIIYIEAKFLKRFPILYSETFEESIIYKSLQNLSKEDLTKIIEFIKNKRRNKNNSNKNNKKIK